MYLDVFDRNPYGTNCWLLAADDADEAVVVDLGFEEDRIRAILEGVGRRAAAVVLTHGHVDHAEAAGRFAGQDVPVYVHVDDALAFADPIGWGSSSGAPLSRVADLRTFVDGDVLRFGGLTLDVIHTPGHTPGSSCFRVDDERLVLSGDLVFAGSIGRSDFPNSDPVAMDRSLRLFLAFPDELDVLPGHGPRTTVAEERASNPFLRRTGA